MLSQFDDEETAAYFERLNSQLRRMPREDRAEIHTELRQHLDALIAAHEELGASPEEAARAALRQFGDPKQIGRRLFGEWRRNRPPSLWSAIGHMTFWKLAMLTISLMTGFSLSHSKHNELIFYSGGNENTAMLSVFLLIFVSPLLAGIVTGLKMPKKAAPGAIYSGLLFALPIFPLMLQNFSDSAGSMLIAFDWLAVSFVGAYAASAHRRGGFYRLTWADFKFRDGEKENSHATLV